MKTMQQWIKEKTSDLTAVGSIPLKHAGVCWDMERTRNYSGPRNDLHVVDLRKAQATSKTPDESQQSIWSSAGSASGACHMEWTGQRNVRHTPLGMLAEMGYDGTMPKGVDFVKMLSEFAKIEGCDWALQMIAALHMGNSISDNDEEFAL
jgi:hypothetical protein